MRKRQCQLVIRMTSDEFKKIKEKVKESGLSQQQYMLAVAINKTVLNTEGLRAVIPEIKRIGNNINQLVKLARITNRISDSNIRYINSGVNDIWLLLHQFIVEHR